MIAAACSAASCRLERGRPTRRRRPTGKPQRGQRENSSAAPHRKNRKPYTVWYDVGTIKQLKQLALDTGMTQQDLMVMAANELFKRHDKPPIAI